MTQAGQGNGKGSGNSLDMDRREFIGLALAALSTLPWLPGCSDDGAPDAVSKALPKTAFDVLRDVVMHLRRSPDHLPARLRSLVAARDWKALHAFVRDEIETWPSGARDFRGDNVRGIRWGARASLRGGAGTPREKADLLASSLVDAGFKARVMQASTHFDAAAIKRIARPRPRTFAPPVDAATLATWRNVLGRSGPAAMPEAMDHDGSEREALLDRLLAAIDARAPRWPGARGFDFNWRPGLAVVVLETDDGPLVLDPVDPASPVVPADMTKLTSAGEPVGLQMVSARLEVATVDDPRKRQLLVEGRWDAGQLIGRALVVATPPVVAPGDWARVRLDDIHAHMPVLRVSDGGQDPTLAKLTVRGQAFTRHAEPVVVDEQGAIRVGDVALEATPADALARVRAITLKAASVGRDEATLVAEVLDADGRTVEGLGTDAFALSVDGEPRGYLMLANRPRLVVDILIDQSLSMPAEYLGQAGEAWVDQVREQVRAAAPHAVVRVTPTTSRLWGALAAASARGGDLLVYLSDGHVDDSRDARIDATLAAGPPALMVMVRDGFPDALDAMAKATAGRRLDVADAAAAAQAIAQALARQAAPVYRLRVATRGLAPGQHRAKLATRDARIAAELEFPVAEDAALPPAICGLYLQLDVDGQRVLRTLAGLDARVAGQQVPTREHVDAATAGLLSGAMVTFEAAAPPLAVWLDDVVSSRLPLEQVVSTAQAGRMEDAFDQLLSSFQPLPAKAWQAGLADTRVADAPLVYHDGFRAALLSSAIDRDGIRTSRMDILPVSRFAAVAADPDVACEAVLRSTAGLALAEAAHYATSTGSLLRGKPLALLDANTTPIHDLAPPARLRWYEALRGTSNDWIVGAQDAGVLAYFQVSRRTGELLAVLPDGSGGGNDIESLVAFTDRLKTVMDLYEAATWSPSGAIHGAPGLSAVAEFGQVLVRLYAAASVAIAMVGVEGDDAQARRLIERLACDAADIVGKGAFAGMPVVDSVRQLVGVLVGREGACG